ncbi:hypothetical protein M0R88_13545 [Halorussus gelatinilyticus]|uniref:Uncharacterized protein n=1 Tax=Halorussus gelatinilyticus TaxID=2937524 RepID=A0A8U0IHI2_9EURY|nr:hypothetical protein [Halorussus gelatinilyticus]UPV99538.1 hypothetical protein M0R88_13545 [Halorussus gelatinilyticus]
MTEHELAERLGAAEVGDHVTVDLADGTSFEGPASPIDYVPDESLRVEVRPEGGTTERYELRAEYDGEWSDLSVRHVDIADGDAEWEPLGDVERIEVRADDEEWEWGPS